MNRWNQRRGYVLFCVMSASAVVGFCGCGSGPGESESKMTSFTSSETKADTAQLFTVPQEQMAHVQVVAAERGSLAQALRL
jgi:membrane fusion protein, heavy metal efflux system